MPESSRSRVDQIEIVTLAFIAKLMLALNPGAIVVAVIGGWNSLIGVEIAVILAVTALLWTPLPHRTRAHLFSAGATIIASLALFNFGPTIGTGLFFMGAALASTFFADLAGAALSLTVLGLALTLAGCASTFGVWDIPNSPEGGLDWLRMGGSSIVPLFGGTYFSFWVRLQLRDAIDAEVAARDRERQANEDFSFVVSHDLMEPVRTVRAFVGLVLEDHGETLDGEARQHLTHAHDAALRMGRLIEDLLRYTRLGEDSLTEVVDATQVAREAGVDLGQLLAENGASIEVGPLPRCVANPTRLRLVFSNLFTNSVRYGRPDVPVKIVVAGSRSGREVVLTITDNGGGIPSTQREQVFEVFKRLARTEAPAGSGLGLAIVKRVIAQSSGRVWLDDNPDGPGTRVYLALPAAEQLQV